MATVKINEISPIDIKSADGCHVMMQSLHRYMTQAGLTQVDIDGGYDGTEASDSSQVPTILGEYSPWMAFGFSDAAQATNPIYISYRAGYGRMGSTNPSHHSWFVQARISTDLNIYDGSSFLNTLHTSGSSGFSTAISYMYENLGSQGDFVRYSGDALTLLFGANSIGRTSNNFGNRSFIYFHIERQKVIDGSFTGGPAIVGDFLSFGQNNDNPHPGQVYYDKEAQGLGGDSALARRVGDSLAYEQSGVPVVAPVYYKSHTRGELVQFRHLFTLPTGVLKNTCLATLNFEGESKRYIHSDSESSGIGFPKQFRLGYSDQTPIFRWDD